MTISQEDARRAIKLLIKFTDWRAGVGPRIDPFVLNDEALEFLYDSDTGDPRFGDGEDDFDPSPMCRCEECPVGGPYTCISED